MTPTCHKVLAPLAWAALAWSAACSARDPADQSLVTDAAQAPGARNAGEPTHDAESAGMPTSSVEPLQGAPADFLVDDDLNDDACVAQTLDATAQPPVIQLVVDTSGSMNALPGGGTPGQGQLSKWEITRDALLAAVDAMPSEVAIGVAYYPNVQGQQAPCYRPEVAVPIARLDDAQRHLVRDSAQRVQPGGGTPTHAAYRFGLEQLRATTLEGNELVLLITDGIPTFTLECGGNGRDRVDVGELVADVAQANAEQIRTFVIGSPGSEEARDELSSVAVEGGTASDDCSRGGSEYCHFDMTQQEDFASALNDALGAITARALACDYEIPPAPFSLDLDLDAISVSLEASDGSLSPFSRDVRGDCTGDFRVADDGRSLSLCSAACDRVQAVLGADPGARVQVRFECTATPE